MFWDFGIPWYFLRHSVPCLFLLTWLFNKMFVCGFSRHGEDMIVTPFAQVSSTYTCTSTCNAGSVRRGVCRIFWPLLLNLSRQTKIQNPNPVAVYQHWFMAGGNWQPVHQRSNSWWCTWASFSTQFNRCVRNTAPQYMFLIFLFVWLYILFCALNRFVK